MTQIPDEMIIQALNELKHEILSHQVFLSCFSSAVRREEVKGLTKSSLPHDSRLLSLGTRREREVPKRIREALEEQDNIEWNG